EDNFYRDIIAIAYTKEELNNLEIDFIKNYNAVKSDDYYNIASGGYINNLAGKTNEEKRDIYKKISESNKGRVITKETRKKISKTLTGVKTGRKLSKEHIQKMIDGRGETKKRGESHNARRVV